jgi:hypothetical protein
MTGHVTGLVVPLPSTDLRFDHLEREQNTLRFINHNTYFQHSQLYGDDRNDLVRPRRLD